jgi:Ca2+-binding EF-hand superfamily protein
MRSTHALFAVFASAFTLLPRAAATPAVDAAALFKSLDANADGAVTEDEAGEAQGLLFRRLVRTGDDDGDGRLTAEEFAAAIAPVRAEKATVEKQGSRLPGADALVVVLAKMDANSDRRLVPDEIPEDYLTTFEQMLKPADANKDGQLDARELARGGPRLSIMATRAAMQKGLNISAELAKLPAEEMNSIERMGAYGRPGDMMADPQQAEEMFARLDANGDDRVSADEAQGPLAERFDAMLERGDRDGDKQLSKQEFLEMSRRLAAMQNDRPDPAASRRLVRQLLNRFDADDDGALTAKEVPRRLAENFDRVDADANGRLDGPELAEVAALMNRGMRQGRPGPGPGGRPADPANGDDSAAPPKRPGKSLKKARNK